MATLKRVSFSRCAKTMGLDYEQEFFAFGPRKNMWPQIGPFVVVTFLAILATLLGAQILGSRDPDWPKNDSHPQKNDNYHFSTHLKSVARKKNDCVCAPVSNFVILVNLIDCIRLQKIIIKISFLVTIFSILRVLYHLATGPFGRPLLCRFVTVRPAAQFLALGDHDPS